MTKIVLALGDLSCQHCVQSVKKILEQIVGVESAEVTLDSATVIGDVDSKALIDAIAEAGYQAQLVNDDAKK